MNPGNRQLAKAPCAARIRRLVWGGLTLSCIALLFAWLFLIRPAADDISISEQHQLLDIARAQLIASASGDGLIDVDQDSLPNALRRKGAAFVSLSMEGDLRGCMIDDFDPHEPLYANVVRNTQLAAQADDRFATIQQAEIERVRIEISIVYNMAALRYENGDDLLSQLTPGIDGILLNLDDQLATYLPSVWDIFPEPAEFLSQLCIKAGWEPNRWRIEPYPLISTYRTFTFSEHE